MLYSTGFIATLEGNGFKIIHLYVNQQNRDYAGLIGALGSGGIIHDLGLVDNTVRGGGRYVGGLVGINNRGSISHSYSTGNVFGKPGSNTGGLAGNYSGWQH